jgi:hypothetical protein
MCINNHIRDIVFAGHRMTNAPQSSGYLRRFTNQPDAPIPDADGDSPIRLEIRHKVRHDDQCLEMWADERRRALLEELQSHYTLVTGHFGAKGFVVDDATTCSSKADIVHLPGLTGVVASVHPSGSRFLLAVPDGRSTRMVMIDLIRPEPLACSPFDLSPSVSEHRPLPIVEGQILVVEHGLFISSGSVSCRREWLKILRQPPGVLHADEDDRDQTMWVDGVPVPNHGQLVGTWDRISAVSNGTLRRVTFTSLPGDSEVNVFLDERRKLKLDRLDTEQPTYVEGYLRHDGAFVASSNPRRPRTGNERSGLKLGGIARPKPDGRLAIEYVLGFEFVIDGLHNTDGIADGDLVSAQLDLVGDRWISADGRIEPVTGQPWPDHAAA